MTLGPGDELLRWVSEVGSGTWTQLRDACAYLTQRHQLTRRPWTLASDLVALGHLDINWDEQRWSVAPPTLNLVPNLGQCVVLTGSRPWYVDERFDEATDDLNVYPFTVDQPPAPIAKFARCASVDDARRIAAGMDAHLVTDPATRLARAAIPADREPLTQAPPPPLDDARRFNPERLSWDPIDDETPGLYRIDLHGRPVHRRRDTSGLWWAIDLAAGEFLELEGRTPPVVKWTPANDHVPATLSVREELSLPVLVERAATICSGLVPQRSDRWRHYLNVPHDVATTIAAALLQPLPSR